MSEYDQLVQEIVSCTLCALSQTRTQAVPGEGSISADFMFVGEGPGYHEDQQGKPFVGPAGQLLDKLLASIGLRREDVYIANMVKCRPPGNRDPLPGEIQACQPYLDRQMQIISPKVVVTLGRFSFSKFFPGEAISKARGKPRTWNGRTIFPMYHPAAALHNPSLLPAIEADFQKLRSLVDSEEVLQEEPEKSSAQQLSFF
jgi:uracil-DNA glycosylase family 4